MPKYRTTDLLAPLFEPRSFGGIPYLIVSLPLHYIRSLIQHCEHFRSLTLPPELRSIAKPLDGVKLNGNAHHGCVLFSCVPHTALLPRTPARTPSHAGIDCFETGRGPQDTRLSAVTSRRTRAHCVHVNYHRLDDIRKTASGAQRDHLGCDNSTNSGCNYQLNVDPDTVVSYQWQRLHHPQWNSV